MLEFVARVLIEVICGVTGHLVLWGLTVGRWDVSNGRDDAATIVGIMFWAAVGMSVWLVFFR